ncbi:hypothetical protein BV25DRAFT_1920832 [Artomyces pyxidatus]|uniref:Uncharacterized protein n=1 Tax=Artomyces pyxidatus TaxID=48021 RepID=A0ACB8SK31_9AGAM|nr:hypothetical protein BV25DRAFT_1920832 [Artomyces pyxidatus]
MTNWRDPARIQSDYLSLLKLIHVLGGIYIWEFVTTCNFELEVLRRRRPYRWTIWVYLCVRISTLIAFSFMFVDIGPWTSESCRIGDIITFAFSYLSVASASLIIVIRTAVLWNYNRAAVALSVGIWAVSTALNIRDLTLVEAYYDPQADICMQISTNRSQANAVGILVSDLVLLGTMLAGLHRHYDAKDGFFGLWRLLFRQGVIWLFLATIAEVPSVVMIYLDLSDPWNIMFPPAALLILAIAATRMHRELSEYGSITTFQSVDILFIP